MQPQRTKTPGGKHLTEIGVAPIKFAAQNVHQTHFEQISTPILCNLIAAIGNDEGDYDEVFDLVLYLVKTNEEILEKLCKEIDNIWTHGAQIAYQIIEDNHCEYFYTSPSPVSDISEENSSDGDFNYFA
ncbi:MAG: hypothetical protein H6909_01940 [Rickettsiaceae bacterium]|nr:hypothetical protein [Rickettsiaceae bacterium]